MRKSRLSHKWISSSNSRVRNIECDSHCLAHTTVVRCGSEVCMFFVMNAGNNERRGNVRWGVDDEMCCVLRCEVGC